MKINTMAKITCAIIIILAMAIILFIHPIYSDSNALRDIYLAIERMQATKPLIVENLQKLDGDKSVYQTTVMHNLQLVEETLKQLKHDFRPALSLGNQQLRTLYNTGFVALLFAVCFLLYDTFYRYPIYIRRRDLALQRISCEENFLEKLLENSMQPLECFLERTAQDLLSQSWLQLESRCAVFLKFLHAGNEQQLKVACNVDVPLDDLEKTESYLFKRYEKPDKFHSGQFDEETVSREKRLIVHESGQYQMLLHYGNIFLGVIVLYPSSQQKINDRDLAFLAKLANFIGFGVARKLAEKKIDFLTYYDELTELPNRLLLQNRLQQVVSVELLQNKYHALLHLDLDRFKFINDSHGRKTGDELLREVARTIKNTIRTENTLARLEGTEFVILLAGFKTDINAVFNEIQTILNDIKNSINNEAKIRDLHFHLSLSTGVVLLTGEERNTDILLKQGQTALFKAKAQGGGGVVFFEPEMQKQADERLRMEKDLRLSLYRNEFQVYYQPQVDENGQIIAAEALLRWKHHSLDFISPVDFMPVAEDTGLIINIGLWILEQVCKQIKSWEHIEGLQHVAVNVSPVQFRHVDFVSSFMDIINKTAINPEKLLLELTEGILIDNVNEVINKMNALKKIGVQFSIDDFGTGYSSLSYLKRFPLDQIKIDKSFVDDIGLDENNQVIIETIIAMTDRMGFSLIAEGVETNAQLHFLKAKGCNYYQGFYFNKPLPVEEFNQHY